MSLFGNLTTEGLEEAQDRLGGFTRYDTDIYTAKIKVAYAGKSQKGAQSVTVILSGGDFGDKEYREELWVTNAKGENWFANKQDASKKVPLPGFTVANDLCLATVGKELHQMDGEEKMVNIYDYEAKKEMPKSVPVLTELTGQEVSIAIVKALENQTEKQGDEYVAKTDGSTKETNNIDKVFNTQTKKTVAEAKGGAEEAQFWDKWLDRNKGQTRDKTSKNTGGSSAGAPQAGAGGGAAPRTSLFGKS